jgi:hypothetical protein
MKPVPTTRCACGYYPRNVDTRRKYTRSMGMHRARNCPQRAKPTPVAILHPKAGRFDSAGALVALLDHWGHSA